MSVALVKVQLRTREGMSETVWCRIVDAAIAVAIPKGVSYPAVGEGIDGRFRDVWPMRRH